MRVIITIVIYPFYISFGIAWKPKVGGLLLHQASVYNVVTRHWPGYCYDRRRRRRRRAKRKRRRRKSSWRSICRHTEYVMVSLNRNRTCSYVRHILTPPP